MDWFKIIGIIAIAIAIAAMVSVVVRNYLRRNPERSKKEAASILKKCNRLREHKLYNNVTLKNGEDEAVADHILVNGYGVFMVCDLSIYGSVYGQLSDENWVCTVGKEENPTRTSIPNVHKRLEKSVEIFRKLLADAKIYNVQIVPLLVKTQDQDVYMTGSKDVILDKKAFKFELERVKYEKDNEYDVKAVKELIEKICGE